MKHPTISAVVIAYNEEENIEACLKTLSFADEIIVIDNESTDDTAKIAKKYTKHVYTAKRVGYVEPIRNLAHKKASGDWILFVDADERIPETLGKKLREIAVENAWDVVFIPRKNIIFGEWIQHTGWWPDHILRFFKKGAISWPKEIHVQPNVSQNRLTLDPQEDYAITHYNYASISQYLQKLDSYTSIQANELIDKKNAFAVTDILARPAQEFFSRFFARKGYKDGLHGLVLSLLQAVSEFILVLKLWEADKFVKKENILPTFSSEAKRIISDFDYWMVTTEINEQRNPLKKAFLKGKRKVR